MVKRKYESPPIREVICEFRLSPETQWDSTVPGLLFSKIESDFPIKETRIDSKIEPITDDNGIQHQVKVTEYSVFLSSDKKTSVQIGPRVLIINCLAPYPGWEHFYPYIDRAFKLLGGIIHEASLERIGLRYINHISIPGKSVELEEYFSFRPFIGDKLPQTIRSFIVGSIFPYNNENEMARVQLTSVESKQKDLYNVVLDIDYFLANPTQVSVENALLWVRDAHTEVYKLFEGCLNDKVRGIFGEVK